MTDYAEEQLNEIEALQSIYPEEYEELESEPHSFRILVNPEEEVEEFPCSLYLNVTYTPTYPDELPEYKIEVIEGDFSSEELEKFTEELKTLAEESIGMVMVFSLASTLKELLSALALEKKAEKERLEQEKLEKELAAEQAKFVGTKLTIPLFLEWQAKFEAEKAEKERNSKEFKLKEAKKGKLTGRQLFESDASLAKSDSTYMDEGDVAVDVSLFEREVIESDSDEDGVNINYDSD
ncbi:RWD-domain-containing protein [Basidiobolus meristosporus CBS 931.73]|uniref:RWD-domain-containing protein n=1 Tax=Basidiobolus meristosporus CBS 931.73 TaxID=1314790 RepID=A0A1Y1XXE9_9FUNG|nr:RWD-domain-containing protein [Basidiobolus meristosporus CBS 931.73]|eukprot:ORX90432.1 RWD-domain-containing protein [Basidiobolus meristosporus CBS 931.73]